ncbi:hypothetical protein [Prevotella sp. 10(H)]|uniref:hypothetical protein n=1 Tax=Prevotella sp. 10(H) TaxID=1158294 RepID=UPI0004A73A29|nr:hypothetical protein [Prevotella sp. 10(H)]
MDKEEIIKDFVKQFYKEKQSFYNTCCVKEYVEDKGALTTKLVSDLKLSEVQRPVFEKFVDTLLTDVFYTILLGIDGESSIGDLYQTYKIIDEKGTDLSGGDIEAYAYEYFHGGLYEKEDKNQRNT